jgi:hypothetical protein
MRVGDIVVISMATILLSSPSGLAQSSGSVAREAVSGPLPGRTGLPSGFTGEFVDRYADVNGVRLHYVIGDPDDGPLVLLREAWLQPPALARREYRHLRRSRAEARKRSTLPRSTEAQ